MFYIWVTFFALDLSTELQIDEKINQVMRNQASSQRKRSVFHLNNNISFAFNYLSFFYPHGIK